MKKIPLWLQGFTLMMLILLTAIVLHIKYAKAEPSPLPSPKPFYLPLNDVLPKDFLDKNKKTPKTKKIQADLDDKEYILKQYDSPIITQYRGDCTAQGLSAASDNILGRYDFKEEDKISQESLWARYKVYSAQSAIEAFSNYKVKREAAWPFGEATWKEPEEKSRFQLKSFTFLGSDHDLAYQAIRSGYPVYWAGSVSQGMASCYGEIGPNSPPTKGGHAVALVGTRVKNSGIQFLVKQSWGEGCGIKGYQWLPASTCEQPGAYCYYWKIESISDSVTDRSYTASHPNPPVGPSPSPSPTKLPDLSIIIEGVPFKCQRTQ